LVFIAWQAASDGGARVCRYVYHLNDLRIAPRVYSGHSSKSFYIKAKFSPDGEHIVSGSSHKSVFIWRTADPGDPKHVLKGHRREVGDVAWCPSEWNKLASCSDDATVRIWTASRVGACALPAETCHGTRSPAPSTVCRARYAPCADALPSADT
jgi:WD40 repeat protein